MVAALTLPIRTAAEPSDFAAALSAGGRRWLAQLRGPHKSANSVHSDDYWSESPSGGVISKDRRYFATSMDKWAAVYGTVTGKMIGDTAPLPDWVESVGLSADSTSLAVTGANSLVAGLVARWFGGDSHALDQAFVDRSPRASSSPPVARCRSGPGITPAGCTAWPTRPNRSPAG